MNQQFLETMGALFVIVLALLACGGVVLLIVTLLDQGNDIRSHKGHIRDHELRLMKVEKHFAVHDAKAGEQK